MKKAKKIATTSARKTNSAAKKQKPKTAVKKSAVIPEKDAWKYANNTEEVDAFMDKLDHPFKAEVQTVREIIKGVSGKITEQVKWKAPSFSYKGYMVTFNLWAKEHVHLVFHNAAILNDKSEFLEGDYPDRRMVYFSSMEDIKLKKTKLEKVIKAWIRLMNKQS
jgi:hypothetical protein